MATSADLKDHFATDSSSSSSYPSWSCSQDTGLLVDLRCRKLLQKEAWTLYRGTLYLPWLCSHQLVQTREDRRSLRSPVLLRWRDRSWISSRPSLAWVRTWQLSISWVWWVWLRCSLGPWRCRLARFKAVVAGGGLVLSPPWNLVLLKPICSSRL